MRKFNYLVLLMVVCFVHFGNAQNGTTKASKDKILGYLDRMEKVLSPVNGQVYHMRYSTSSEFYRTHNISNVSTKTEMLITDKKIVLDDNSMKIYGDDKNMFVVLPKVRKIYWNDSDPRLFTENNAQKKFLDIERTLLATAAKIEHRIEGNIDHITITPGKDFQKESNLTLQRLDYDLKEKRVLRVENKFNNKSKMKKQVVVYEIIDYKSSKKIKKPLEYIFDKSELKRSFRGFEIVDNRKK